MTAGKAKVPARGIAAITALVAIVGCAPTISPNAAPAAALAASPARDSITALVDCTRDVARELGYTRIDTALGRDQRYVGLVLAPGERPIIAERRGAINTAVLIAVVSPDSAGRPALLATARQYDASRLPIAVERSAASSIRFDEGGATRAPRPVAAPLPPDILSDLSRLRTACGSPANHHDAD